MIRLSPARIWLVSFLMYFAPAEIREMYQQGISMYHIAQLYGTDRKTIAHWVKP